MQLDINMYRMSYVSQSVDAYLLPRTWPKSRHDTRVFTAVVRACQGEGDREDGKY
jgi:hypothetical protein